MTTFDFTFSKPGQGASPRRTSKQLRILILCDARGANANRPTLRDRRLRALDIDTFDARLAHYAPQCVIDEATTLSLTDLDHFTPDWLFRNVPSFAALPQAAAKPVSSPSTPTQKTDTKDETLERLLGRPAQTDSPAARAGGLLDRFIKDVVATESDDPAPTAQTGPDAQALAHSLRAVLHHPQFQRLEATWRGLHDLVTSVETGDGLTIKMFDVSLAELDQDLRQADHSVLAERLIGDADQTWDLIVLEHHLEASDAMVIAGLGTLAQAGGGKLLCDVALPAPNEQPDELWQALRHCPAARGIVVAAPRVLLRAPYGKQFEPPERFEFEECAAAPNNNELLWGSAALLLATCRAQSFEAGEPNANLSDQPAANDRPQYVFERDGERVAQPVAEQLLSDAQAEQLESTWGILPLRAARHGNRLHLVALESVAG